MSARELRRLRIVDLVRRWPATIRQLADLGISPRYLEWTIEAAAGDLGINCDRVVSRLQPVILVPEQRRHRHVDAERPAGKVESRDLDGLPYL